MRGGKPRRAGLKAKCGSHDSPIRTYGFPFAYFLQLRSLPSPHNHRQSTLLAFGNSAALCGDIKVAKLWQMDLPPSDYAMRNL